MEEETRLAVSLYLVKTAHAAALQNAFFSEEGESIPLRDQFAEGRFLPLADEATEPRWLPYVRSLLSRTPAPDQLLGQAPGGLLYIPFKQKHFIFTFGHAHNKLEDDWLEPEFGKQVALSVIPDAQLVELRAEQIFARRHIASERAPRAAPVREFGFEADRDLVAAVEGTPSAKYLHPFGKKVRGGTSLRFGLLFGELLETLDTVAERFDSRAHLKVWPQMAYLSPVRDSALIAQLDAKLDALLSGNRPADHISLAAPAVRTGEQPYPDYFVIGRLTKNSPRASYLLFGNWEALMKDNDADLSTASAHATPVHLLDAALVEIDRCTMYACFSAEVSLDNRTYVLSSGIWQEAKRKFITETNNLVKTLKGPLHELPAWNQADDEGTYNAGTPRTDKSLWLFDKKNVWFGGGQSRFEFCDLMHRRTQTLYFVKQPTASAGLSHLCEQTRRTAENFFSVDDSFRKKLAAKLKDEGKIKDLKWLAGRPKRHEWNLCLVSMGKSASEFPFFAKCGVARLVRELQHDGFQVSFQAV